MFTEEITAWADRVAVAARGDVAGDQLSQLLDQPASWRPAAAIALIQRLAQLAPPEQGKQRWAWQRMAAAITEWFRSPRFERRSALELERSIAEPLEHLYSNFAPVPWVQWHVLGWWAELGTPQALQRWVQSLVQAPPSAADGLPYAFAPWFRPGAPSAHVFPALLEALQHRDLAAAILDLANHVTRQVPGLRHPAAERVRQLEVLMAGVTQQLQSLAESTVENAARDPLQRRRVAEAISLLVSLCDALALIGDPQSAAKLHQVLDLPHRRVQIEAAAALARMEDPQGQRALQNLAAFPVVRLRALAYADELGQLETIDPEFRTATARAEAALACWLAEPSRYGAPPTSLDLIDTRELYWPGFDTPQTCYLFRFAYRTARGELLNVGMSGPCTHALRVDGTELEPLDLYATFAGLQVSHPEVRELKFTEELVPRYPALRNYVRDLRATGYQEFEPQWWGEIFEQHYLVGTARRDDVRGTVVYAPGDVVWIPEVPAGFTADLAYALFKGRQIVQTFNPSAD